MNNSFLANHIYDRLIDAINLPEDNNRKQFLKVYSIWCEFADLLLESEALHFSSRMAKTVFLLDKYSLVADNKQGLVSIRKFAGQLRRNAKLYCSADEWRFAAGIISSVVSTITSEPIPDELKIWLSQSNIRQIEFRTAKPKSQLVGSFRAVLLEKGRFVKHKESNKTNAELICESEEYGKIRIILFGLWLDIYDYGRVGDMLNFIGMKQDKVKPDKFITTFDTIIVFEPDYLVDATDIAGCFLQEGFNPNLYLLKKFKNINVNPMLLAGKHINNLFDEILVNPDIDFETAYKISIKDKPIALFTLTKNNKEDVKLLKDRCRTQFENLKNAIHFFKGDFMSIEASFISPQFGIQGRLDVMLEYMNDPNRKDIIELKSGRAPSVNLIRKSVGGATISTGIYQSHSAQICCYNLLLETAYGNRTGNSQILYSIDSQIPLRNAMPSLNDKQEVIACRNRIVSFDKAILHRDYSIFDLLSPARFGRCNSFVEQDVMDFHRKYSSFSELEKSYFYAYLSFISTESFIGRIGSSEHGGGFSDFWKLSSSEKEMTYNVLSNLEFNSKESDFEKMHIVLYKRGAQYATSPFRAGDICLLQPDIESGNGLPLGQLIKCSIMDVMPDKVILSLRNKLIKKDIFSKYKFWTLEPDFLDAGSRTQFSSIYSFLNASDRKKRILFGLEKPQFDDVESKSLIKELKSKYSELNSNQLELFAGAITARDYFLMQGPPGTGKTSYMLKSLTKYFYDNTDINILLLAYTNRAVDEICSVLKTINPKIDFLRLGNKHSSQHPDKLLSCLADEMDLKDLYRKAIANRIIVSTVSSALFNTELFEFQRFDLAIIDEASQILEPHLIGILSFVDKFIMIGDERQLPAVVVQSESDLTVREGELSRIGVENLSSSLFERLINVCAKNNWTDCTGMLRYQARMHKDIMQLANDLCYRGNLRVFPGIKRLKSAESRFDKKSNDKFEKILANKRAVFIPCKAGGAPKTSDSEALTAIEIVRLAQTVYGDDFNEDTVGIISPFRAQCAKIKSMLPENLRCVVAVDTVERFQGAQKDIIIISFAASNDFLLKSISSETVIDGLKLDRKLNVAITRAKEHLVLLGNPVILNKSPIHSRLINLCK